MMIKNTLIAIFLTLAPLHAYSEEKREFDLAKEDVKGLAYVFEENENCSGVFMKVYFSDLLGSDELISASLLSENTYLNKKYYKLLGSESDSFGMYLPICLILSENWDETLQLKISNNPTLIVKNINEADRD